MPHSAASVAEIAEVGASTFASDVRAGLTASPKTMPARWLYDAIGSALFEAICLLPWYPITRAETAMLERIAPEVARLLPSVADVVELGPGSGEKLARLMAPFAERQDSLTAHLVDVSADALDAAERTLSRLPRVRVVRHNAPFEAGLRHAASSPRRGGRLVAFLGSNIGNFDPGPAEALLSEIADALEPGDALLLGADLVKPEAVLRLAYDDPLGVTAAFNRNLLSRMNRELGADFDLGRFRHRMRWDAAASRVEMHLVSITAQQVRIPGAGLTVDFARGETIWTESSHKYDLTALQGMGLATGLRVVGQWTDDEARFALTLFQR